MNTLIPAARGVALGALALAALASCRSGTGTDPARRVGPVDGASAKFAQQCSPANPYRNDVGGARAGSLAIEKQWLRAFFDDNYLWYDEVPAVNPTDAAYSTETADGYYGSIRNYFNALRTKNLTETGAAKDRFSFTSPTLAYNQLSQGGVVSGYGLKHARYKSNPPNRDWRIVEVEPNAPAAAAGLRRGDALLSVDGVDFVCAGGGASPPPECATQAGVDKLNAGLSPAAGTAHSFTYSRPGAGTVSVSMTGASVTTTPVPVASVLTAADGAKVGYLLFDSHTFAAERPLREAIASFGAQGVNELVLDLRYNGGGFLYIASQLAYMVGGARTYSGSSSKVFEQTQYNAKLGNDTPTPFYNTSCDRDAGFRCTSNNPLPTLNLARVYVIATGDTCSASESIINALRGVDVNVRLFGTTTCGKPYGFTQKDNCGVSYFPIEFRGVNNKGFGDYADGFLPGGTGASAANVPGCRVGDDLSQPLGDAREGMLATALRYRQTGACASATASDGDGSAPAKATDAAVRDLAPRPWLGRGPEETSRILLPGGR